MNAWHNPAAAPALCVATAVMNGEPCLDAASLAALLGCAPHHVQHQLAKRLDFPRPLIDVSCRVRYWRAVDVLRWLYQPGTTRAMGLADLAAPRLDAAGLADLLGCTRQHAADHIATRADFPPPCINVSRRMRFWLYRDVLQWLTQSGSNVRSGAHAAELLSTADVAQLLDCTCEQMGKRLARHARFPAPAVQLSRRLRYWHAADVRAWLQSQQRSQKGGAV
ncbi:helix-turn-helix transcriptional regulator [Comamonas koreensis]|uniref:Helix-turn-helix domain-containing protein n=1 Tax=Comamonas koreensis TaxID=160825 RepID=A0AAW4XS24_9BURK|nr:helix-turn-helix domain-containing protein [Comamonas koreensis]MCD2163828.1 helix-turn-helix domain-containing protein [Comamonas koreensis]